MYRARREARADRLMDWAEKRQVAAAATLERDRHLTEDHAFNTQPGHIPERARVIAREDRAHESLEKAGRMEQRASGIKAQLDTAIYSDDPDAIEQLEKRIAGLEAERARIKAFNASCRAGTIDLNVLHAAQKRDYLSTKKACPYMIGSKGEMAAYVLTNLGGNINRQKKRLESLKRRREQSANR